MPYIRADRRPHARIAPEEPGELNYAITRLVDEYLERKGLRYQAINDVVGVLECAKLELYRRVAAGYEDGKIDDNGDAFRSHLPPQARRIR